MDLKLSQENDAWMHLESDVAEELEEELKREPTEEELTERLNEIQQDPGFDIQDYVREYQDQELIY